MPDTVLRVKRRVVYEATEPEAETERAPYKRLHMDVDDTSPLVQRFTTQM